MARLDVLFWPMATRKAVAMQLDDVSRRSKAWKGAHSVSDVAAQARLICQSDGQSRRECGEVRVMRVGGVLTRRLGAGVDCAAKTYHTQRVQIDAGACLTMPMLAYAYHRVGLGKTRTLVTLILPMLITQPRSLLPETSGIPQTVCSAHQPDDPYLHRCAQG